MPMDDVIASVREAANWTGATPATRYRGRRPRQPGRGSPMRRRRHSPIPIAGFEARIVPENITLLPKTASQTTGGNAWNERTVVGEEGRQYHDHPARARRDARRDQGDRRRRSARADATTA